MVIDTALENATLDPGFAWYERLPSEFYNPDFTKELSRYIRDQIVFQNGDNCGTLD